MRRPELNVECSELRTVVNWNENAYPLSREKASSTIFYDIDVYKQPAKTLAAFRRR